MKKNTKILIIDDDPNYLLLLKDALEQHNHQINVSVHAYEHIGKVNKQDLKDFDLAIIDLVMPDCDGITTALIIRSQVHIPIMILTAHSSDDRLNQFDNLLEPIISIEKGSDIKGTSNSIFSYLKIGKDFLGLKRKVDNQDVVSYAIGFIMSQTHCDIDTAKQKVKTIARNNRDTIISISQKIINMEIAIDD